MPKVAMWQLILGNGLNISLDLLFVVGFGWGVAGAAWASVLAEYGTLILALYLVAKVLKQHDALAWSKLVPQWQGVGRLLLLFSVSSSLGRAGLLLRLRLSGLTL